MKFWLSDALVDSTRAAVSVLDHGFTVGDGVFETLKVVPAPDGSGGVPFAMDRHVARLQRSAEGMGIAAPEPRDVGRAMLAVCAANPQIRGRGRMRVTVTSGAGPLGSDRGRADATLAVTIAPATPWPATTVLALSPWPRNDRSPVTGLKTTSYAENVLVLAHAKSLGADEALLSNLAGDVCEGTGSNVFLVLDDTLVTPPLSSGCLAGITRELVIQWCAAAGAEVVERPVPLSALAEASEVFVTSSTRDVHPVTEVLDEAGRRVWRAPTGDHTRRAAEAFAGASARDWNP